MRVLILVNGEPPSAAFLAQIRAEHDLLIAADGAAQRAIGLGQTPDIICGDFDSIDLPAALIAFPGAEFVPLPDQNHADLEKAVLLARQRGALSITVAGALGGRIDHTLGNFGVLLRYHSEIPLSIVEDASEVRAISGTVAAPGEWTISTRPGDTISLISLDGRARATITGVKWPLDRYQLPTGTQGISNRATGEQVRVLADGGALLVSHLRQSEDVE
jgi:thiamine pyrophosphokinase